MSWKDFNKYLSKLQRLWLQFNRQLLTITSAKLISKGNTKVQWAVFKSDAGDFDAEASVSSDILEIHWEGKIEAASKENKRIGSFYKANKNRCSKRSDYEKLRLPIRHTVIISRTAQNIWERRIEQFQWIVFTPTHRKMRDFDKKLSLHLHTSVINSSGLTERIQWKPLSRSSSIATSITIITINFHKNSEMEYLKAEKFHSAHFLIKHTDMILFMFHTKS